MNRLPIISVPSGLANTNTGRWVYDVMPLVTMAACVPTLFLYYRSKRWTDLAVFSLGFALAIFYHVCHMHVDGLQGAALFGISGPLWRTWDIICAQWLLARTFGHVVGARHWLTQVITNTVFPAVCLYYFWTASEALPMKNIMHTLVAVMLTTLAAKLLVEGVHTLPKYCRRRGTTTLGLFMLGFIAFPMPELFPRHYWLFHSLWHVLLAAGYYQLYALIEAESLAAYKEARRHKHVRGKRQHQANQTRQSPSVTETHDTLLSEANTDAQDKRQAVGQPSQAHRIQADTADSDYSSGTEFDAAEAKCGLDGLRLDTLLPPAIVHRKKV
ncbi:hypothetical protein ABBQ38_012887 [Trebouxia sp. C0009 RCD-2024]